MVNQQYLIIENNIVTNAVMWDGDTNIWLPPKDSIQLIQATTPTKVWEYIVANKDYELVEKIGVGEIGFTWNGQILTTNQEKPPKPNLLNQPQTIGILSA